MKGGEVREERRQEEGRLREGQQGLTEAKGPAGVICRPTIAALLDRLGRYRFPLGVEQEFQEAVAAVLQTLECQFEREFNLGAAHGRIDFYVPLLRLGLELKVKGSPSAVLDQLRRYARSSQIEALILVTGRARLGAMPLRLAGKPLYIVSTWRGGL